LSLEDLVAAELATSAPPEVQALVAEILRRHGESVTAVLFYGSCRRTGDMTGLLDLYVLYDSHRRFHHRHGPALLNRLLPPNVMVLGSPPGEGGVRAKVAVLSERQFAARTQPDAWDTTIWTRFAQPATLVFARNAASRDRIIKIIAEAVRTAVFWAIRFRTGPATSADDWRGLFAQTYRAEIRPERQSQPELLYRANAQWFDRIFEAVQAEPVSRGARRPPRWALRRLWGKPLNLLRLGKAVFTFENSLDYVVWKLQRHSGLRLPVTDWQRRHPLLAAPALLLRLRRMRADRY
jgi:hypothetical protein